MGINGPIPSLMGVHWFKVNTGTDGNWVGNPMYDQLVKNIPVYELN